MSLSGDLTSRPPRLTFTNMGSGETVEMPFIPDRLTERVLVGYARKKIVGMSHTVLQYGNTENYSIPNLDLFFRGVTQEEANALNEGRKFLLSLAYAREGARAVRDGGPPRILFIWPQLISMTFKMSSIEIEHRKFNKNGASVEFNARVGLEEVRDVRLTSEDVRTLGTVRDSGSQGLVFSAEEAAGFEEG